MMTLSKKVRYLYFLFCLLCLHKGVVQAQQKIDKSSFANINLDYPGLEGVKNAVESNRFDVAAATLLKYYKTKLQANRPDFSNMETSVDTVEPLSAATRETADNALKHLFKTQESYGFFDFGQDINWQLWPVKDNEVRWQLHRVKWWLSMALAYRKTKDEKYAKEWIYQFDDWAKKNPLGLSADNDRFAWRPLEVSDRIQSLVQVIHIFLQSPHFTPEFLIRVLNSYQQQADYLPSHYATEGNHRLFEAQRVLFAGGSFPELKNADNWRKSGIEVLNTEIKKQVYSDGVQFELSPVYHAASIDIFTKAYRSAQNFGLEHEFPASYKSTIEKMVLAFINITFPNYNQPMFGDSWIRKKDVRLKQFSSWAQLFPDNPFIQYFASDGKQGKAPSWLSNAASNAGFYTFRNGWTNASTILMLKASPPGEFHAQPDNGTFELWANGRNFTPDAGCFVYSGDAAIMKKRDWFRQTRVHSTLTLNNENMIITKAQQNKWTTGKDLTVLTYTNPSYTNLKHQRTVLFVDQKYFVVIDRAIGNAAGKIGIHYQLKEDSKPDYNNKSNAVNTTYSDGNNLLIQCFNREASLKQEEGKVSYSYGEEIDRPAFAFETAKGTHEHMRTLVSILYPYQGNTAPKISLTENKGNNYQDGLLDIKLTLDGKVKSLKLDINQ